MCFAKPKEKDIKFLSIHSPIYTHSHRPRGGSYHARNLLASLQAIGVSLLPTDAQALKLGFEPETQQLSIRSSLH